MEPIQPRQTIPEAWASQAACPVCHGRHLSIFRVEGSPDKIFCPDCKMMFAVSQDAAHILVAHVPALLAEHKKTLKGAWVTVADLRALVPPSDVVDEPDVRFAVAPTPPEEEIPAAPVEIIPAPAEAPVVPSDAAAPVLPEPPAGEEAAGVKEENAVQLPPSPAPFVVTEGEPGELRPEEVRAGEPAVPPFIDSAETRALEQLAPSPAAQTAPPPRPASRRPAARPAPTQPLPPPPPPPAPAPRQTRSPVLLLILLMFVLMVLFIVLLFIWLMVNNGLGLDWSAILHAFG